MITSLRRSMACLQMHIAVWGPAIAKGCGMRLVCAFVAIAFFFVGPTSYEASAGTGIDMVPVSYVFEAIDAANSILLTAYTLQPDSDIVRRLQDAAHHGAHVVVGLDDNAFAQAQSQNDDVASLLELSSIEVHKIPESHIKVAFVDGAMYLSDRNWPSSSNEQVVVRDTIPTDRRIVYDALFGGRFGFDDHFWTKKSDALKAEAAVIMSRTSNEVDVESETFGAGTPVFDAILARVSNGDSAKVLFSASDYARSAIARHAVASLQMHHVEVRLGTANEKFAIEGYNCWFGSANATRDLPTQVEFGIALRDAGLATRLHSQFESEWRVAPMAPTQLESPKPGTPGRSN